MQRYEKNSITTIHSVTLYTMSSCFSTKYVTKLTRERAKGLNKKLYFYQFSTLCIRVFNEIHTVTLNAILVFYTNENRKPSLHELCKRGLIGDPGGILTRDTQNRNLLLYTTELRGQKHSQGTPYYYSTLNEMFCKVTKKKSDRVLLEPDF